MMKIFGRLAESVGHRRLKVGSSGEGEKLMHLSGNPQQRRRRAHKADFPACQREYLAGGAYLDGALPHARDRDQGNMFTAIENHMLPNLVADGDGVKLLT